MNSVHGVVRTIGNRIPFRIGVVWTTLTMHRLRTLVVPTTRRRVLSCRTSAGILLRAVPLSLAGGARSRGGTGGRSNASAHVYFIAPHTSSSAGCDGSSDAREVHARGRRGTSG